MCRSWSCLSFLAAEINPGAQSVTMVIGPGWRRDVVRLIIPVLRSSVFSEGMRAVEIIEVK